MICLERRVFFVGACRLRHRTNRVGPKRFVCKKRPRETAIIKARVKEDIIQRSVDLVKPVLRFPSAPVLAVIFPGVSSPSPVDRWGANGLDSVVTDRRLSSPDLPVAVCSIYVLRPERGSVSYGIVGMAGWFQEGGRDLTPDSGRGCDQRPGRASHYDSPPMELCQWVGCGSSLSRVRFSTAETWGRYRMGPGG